MLAMLIIALREGVDAGPERRSVPAYNTWPHPPEDN